MKPPILASSLALAGALASVAMPALAQPYGYPDQRYQAPAGPPGGPGGAYQQGWRAGYRAGYQSGRRGARYDDRPLTPGFYGDPDQRWRTRYGQRYTYNDDRFYQECRNSVDPAGVIAGALIGGLLGNAVSRGGGRAPGTVAGVVVGGALGAGLTQHMDCGDRSYAYKTYYDGLNSGRAHSDWQWEDPQDGHYGDFRIGEYYTDPDGFRCADYTQQVWIDGQRQYANGHACQQPDGTWAMVD